jgi:hypothetical protein
MAYACIQYGCVSGPREIEVAVRDRLGAELLRSNPNGRKSEQVDGHGDRCQCGEWQCPGIHGRLL